MMEFDLEGLLDTVVMEAAVAAGRSGTLAVRQFGASRAIAAGSDEAFRSGNADRWSPADDAFLREWAGVLGDEELAERLGRTPVSIRIRRRRKGHPGPMVHPDYLTAQGVARVLGVDVHSVCKWIDRGLLPEAELAPLAGRKVWRIGRAAFTAWALRPENWIYFIRAIRDGRIRDARLARLIERRAAVWGDEWWTSGQVARYHGVDSNDVTRYIYAGRLPAVQWGNWWVLRSKATRPGLRFYKGKGGTTFERSGTPAGDAFIVLAVAVGVPWSHIGRLMGRSYRTSIQSRFAAIARRDLVPWLVRAYDLPVRYRTSDGAVWADWRPLAHRFPVVARAWAKWANGSPLTSQERYALAGTARAAVVWARGADDPLAVALSGRGLPGRETLEEAVSVYLELAATERQEARDAELAG